MTAQITLIGRVGNAPALQNFASSKKVVFSVAVNEYKGKDKPQVTTWYDVECWNGGTDRVLKLVTKGRQIVVIGQLSLNTYFSEKDSKEKTRPVVRLSHFQLCGRKPQDEEEPGE